jgi:hypothetical protein
MGWARSELRNKRLFFFFYGTPRSSIKQAQRNVTIRTDWQGKSNGGGAAAVQRTSSGKINGEAKDPGYALQPGQTLQNEINCLFLSSSLQKFPPICNNELLEQVLLANRLRA